MSPPNDTNNGWQLPRLRSRAPTGPPLNTEEYCMFASRSIKRGGCLESLFNRVLELLSPCYINNA